jgi:hypothetical protein
MALADDIAAVRNDEALSEQAKRAAIYAIKVDGLVSRLSGFSGQSWTLDSVTYTLQFVRAMTVKGVYLVEIGVKRTRTGWVFDDGGIAQLRLVNPPLISGSNGKAIDGMTNPERLAYVRELIASLPPGVQT